MQSRLLTKRYLLAAVLILGLVWSTACSSKGPKLYPVTGKVFYNGKPAKGAQVIFHPKEDKGPSTLHPTGTVEEDGSFSLSSREEEDGAPAGTYYVFIRWPESAMPDVKGNKRKYIGAVPGDALKGKYTDHKNPKFFADVKEGSNQLEPFQITD
jgi:hypothetical protein